MLLKSLRPALFTVATAFPVVFATKPAAAQTIYGPGGLLLNPTASVPAKGSLTPAVLVMLQKLDRPGHLTWQSYNLDYGASDRLELGLTHLKISPGGAQFQQGSTGGYAKYMIVPDKPGRLLTAAVGASALGFGDANSSTAFLALRYTPACAPASHPTNLHLGALYINELDGIRHQTVQPYAGVDRRIFRNLTLFAEARAAYRMSSGTSDGTRPARAIGAIYQPNEDWKIVLAYANNGWNKAPLSFSIGIGYGLGGGR